MQRHRLKFLSKCNSIYISPYTPMTLALEKYLKEHYQIESRGFIDSVKKGQDIYSPQDIEELSICNILILSPNWDIDIHKNLVNYIAEENLTIVVKSDNSYKKSIVNSKYYKYIDKALVSFSIFFFNFFNLKVSNLWIKRIGELCLESEGLLRKLELGKISKDKKYLVLSTLDQGEIANRVLYDLYKETFKKNKNIILIENHLIIRYLRHLMKYHSFKNDFYFDLWQQSNQYEEFINVKSIISFDEEEIEKGNKILEKLNIQTPYVCIFSRDSSYTNTSFMGRDWSHNDYRDGDINTYYLAIEYLIQHGYSVVRLGSIVTDRMAFKHDKCIDYPYSKFQSEFMDIFLVSQCSFAIGNHSGILDVCNAFGKTRLGVNNIPIDAPTYATKNDIYIPKKLKIDGKYVSLNRYLKIMNSSELSHFRTQTYKELNLEIEENSPLEILMLVKEYLGDFKYEEHDRLNMQKYFEAHSHSKQFSNVKTKIGAQFLRDNSWFIDI